MVNTCKETVKQCTMSSVNNEFSVHKSIDPVNAQSRPTYHLLALLGAHHIIHVSRIRVKIITFRVKIIVIKTILN